MGHTPTHQADITHQAGQLTLRSGAILRNSVADPASDTGPRPPRPRRVPAPAPDGHVTCTMQYHDVMTLEPFEARNLVTINENDRNK